MGEGRDEQAHPGEQAGGGHIDIDPLPRYEMAHWPAMAAASLRHQERARIGRKREEGGPAENAANGLQAWGARAFSEVLWSRFRPYIFKASRI